MEKKQPKPGIDFDPNGELCQDDYEYLTGTGQYANEERDEVEAVHGTGYDEDGEEPNGFEHLPQETMLRLIHAALVKRWLVTSRVLLDLLGRIRGVSEHNPPVGR